MRNGKRLLGVALALALLVFSAPPSFPTMGSTHNAIDSVPAFLSHMSHMATSQAFAEEGVPRVRQAKLSIWPEYDEPRVLVIYDGYLADTSGYPRQVQFRIPKGIEISQVCGISDKGEHLCQLYEVKQLEGDYNILTYNLPVPHFFFEYYYNPIGSDPVRNISHSFSSDQPIDKLDVELQQPLRSTDFTTTPSAMSTGSDKEGFKYTLLNYENVKPDQKIDFKISYSKQDSRPSVAKTQQGAGGGFSDSSNLNIWMMLGGAALVGLVGYYLLSRRNTRLVPQPVGYGGRAAAQMNYTRQATSKRQTGHTKGARAQGAAAFCTGCGTPLDADDRFCSKCGKRSKNG